METAVVQTLNYSLAVTVSIAKPFASGAQSMEIELQFYASGYVSASSEAGLKVTALSSL